jgi:hypothetical protein
MALLFTVCRPSVENLPDAPPGATQTTCHAEGCREKHMTWHTWPCFVCIAPLEGPVPRDGLL